MAQWVGAPPSGLCHAERHMFEPWRFYQYCLPCAVLHSLESLSYSVKVVCTGRSLSTCISFEKKNFKYLINLEITTE